MHIIASLMLVLGLAAQSDFFDIKAQHHRAAKSYDYDFYFLDFIRSNRGSGSRLVDIGGGSGQFAALVKDACPDIQVSVVDPSIELMRRIPRQDIAKVQGWLPSCLNVTGPFDFVHVKEVLHHITGRSVVESKSLAMESLLATKRILNPKGYFSVHELYYESYLHPKLTRTMIFYVLRVQNRLKIRIPGKHFLRDLQVCFYTREEFTEILKNAGFEVVLAKEEEWQNVSSKKLMFMRNWGRMLFVCRVRR